MIEQCYLGPEDIKRCQIAMDEASKDIGSSSAGIRDEMAKRILARARSGEKHVDELKRSAMAWILSA